MNEEKEEEEKEEKKEKKKEKKKNYNCYSNVVIAYKERS
jgi:hypothetical protein